MLQRSDVFFRNIEDTPCSVQIGLAEADTAGFYALAGRFAEMRNFRNISSYIQWQKQLNSLSLKPDINRC